MPTENDIMSAEDAVEAYVYESAGPDWQTNQGEDLSLSEYKDKRRVKVKTISSVSLGYKLEITHKYMHHRGHRCYGATKMFLKNISSL